MKLETLPRSLRHAGLIAGVFLTIWSAKLFAIARYGSDLPYWDQWGKEGEMLFQPWFERHEFWRNLLIPHNEHRIAPTLVLNFLLLRWGGNQWDARVQCVANGALHAAFIAGLAWWALKRFGPRWGVAAALVATAIAAPPIATENILGGFQSQFYFLMLFSLLAIGGLLGARALSLAWWAGLLCAALASVSMGSGMLVAAPVLAIAAWRCWSNVDRRDAMITLATALLIGAVGAYFRPQAPWHTPLHAHSLSEYVAYAARCLSWPVYRQPWLAALFWWPWVALAIWRLRHRGSGDRATRVADFVLASGAWVLVQVAAVSYSRGGGSILPAPRYGDVSALGLLLNFFALAVLGRAAGIRTAAGIRRSEADTEAVPSASSETIAPASHGIWPWAVAWAVVLVVAVGFGTVDAFHGNLPSKRRENGEYEKNVRAFVLTDNFEAFSKAELPFPSPQWLADFLHKRSMRPLLPASVREPITVEGLAGPVPPAPPLQNRRTRTLTAPGEWQSPVLRPASGWWKIETAGDVGKAGASLELVSARDGERLATIAPTKPAGDDWRAAYLRAPREPAILVGKIAPPARWMAFSEPVEMASLSFWTWRLTEHAGWVMAIGALLLVGFAYGCSRIRLGLASRGGR